MYYLVETPLDLEPKLYIHKVQQKNILESMHKLQLIKKQGIVWDLILPLQRLRGGTDMKQSEKGNKIGELKRGTYSDASKHKQI